MHHTRTAIAATLLATAALTSCSSSSEPAAAKPTPTVTVNKSEQFLTAVKQADITSWDTAGPTDTELLAYPPQWCAGLDAGHSVAYLFGEGGMYPIGMEWGTLKPEAYKVLVLGVTAYCPQRRDQVTGELRQIGQY